MALDKAALKDLLQKLDADREAYLLAVTKVHETLARALAVHQPTSSAAPSNQPGVQSAPTAAPSPLSISPTLSPTLPARRLTTTSTLDLESFKKRSLFTGDESSESGDDESFFVQEALAPESFTEDQLRDHLEHNAWGPHGRLILGDVLQAKEFLKRGWLFQEDTYDENDTNNYTHANCYEVGTDGAALPTRTESQNISEVIWQSLKSTNADPTKERKAVGKIAVIREPSAIIFGAVHLTMDRHFDMDEIYRLLTDDSPTKAYMKGCFETDSRQQRSFLFCFKYHTIVGGERQPMEWQQSDQDLTSTATHIPISTCSSVVALSLSGKPCATLRNRSRKSKSIVGQVFDPFAPWRVVSLQCYPDWDSSVDAHEYNRHYVNGPEAFLVTLLSEYRDAHRRFLEVNKRIVRLATPPSEFMFNRKIRDNLLFEDQDFTYSRRYFWAFQTLAVMNDNIQSMIDAYKDTFTPEVWDGHHSYIWPGTKDQSSRYSNWRKRMAGLRKQFEKEIDKLEHVLHLNIQEQKDIKSLRDQLFSGTSVLESRQAVKLSSVTVQQGHNIKLLTLVSIFFLPLTFITSVFGMSDIHLHGFTLFGIVTVVICVPTYLLIGSLNSHRGVNFWKARTHAVFMKIGWAFAMILTCFIPSSERSKQLKSRYMKQEEPPVTGTQRRQSRTISTYEGLQTRSQHPALHRKSEVRETTCPSFAPPAKLANKATTVKFDLSSMNRPPKSSGRSQPAYALSDTTLSDHDPLDSARIVNGQEPPDGKRQLLRTFSNRFTGHRRPVLPV